MLKSRLHLESEPASLNDDKESVAEHLAARLLRNELALFLGSGVSAPLNIPTWEELVRGCCEDPKVSIKDHKINVNPLTKEADPPVPRDDLLRLMSRVRKKFNGNDEEYHKLIQEKLYKDIHLNLKQAPFLILRKELLISIGALISGFVNGKITEIITYNFDNLLEWYLGLLGFKVNSIQEIPSLLCSADTNIYHPHGFLPINSQWQKSDFIVFDKKSYEERFDVLNQNPWWPFLGHLIGAKQFLFLGIRELDPTLGPFLRSMSEKLSSVKHSKRRIIGFWIFSEKYKNEEHMDEINEYGCVPLYFKSHEDIPKYLIKVKQIAAGLIIS